MKMNENTFNNVLIIGSGPVGINVSIMLSKGFCKQVGMVTRNNYKSKKFLKELKQNNFQLKGNISTTKISSVSGNCTLNKVYTSYKTIENIWDTVILCTPSDSYMGVIKELDFNILSNVDVIILASPEFASNLLIDDFYKKKYKKNMEIISFSNYFGATNYTYENSLTEVTTNALKKKVYIGSNKQTSLNIKKSKDFLNKFEINCEYLDNILEVESKNITIFVHPPFLLNDVSLDQIFSYDNIKKFVYKLYPEGPITMKTIHIMCVLWKEISSVYNHFDIDTMNLLKFLNDNNYPVLEASICKKDIDNFTNYDDIHQEYLLYVRYASILIDPFSIPNKEGNYFDFSRVDYSEVYQDSDGKWNIPRRPLEDYKKLKLLYSLGQLLNLQMEYTKYLLDLFDEYLEKFIQNKGRKNINNNILKNRLEDAKIIIKSI